MGKGNILVGSTLQMDAMQKTFSLALSREMAPSARIVAYFIYNGEVVSGAMNFHVDDTKLKTVHFLNWTLPQQAASHSHISLALLRISTPKLTVYIEKAHILNIF